MPNQSSVVSLSPDDFEELAVHLTHSVSLYDYADEDGIVSIALECHDCDMRLWEADNPWLT